MARRGHFDETGDQKNAHPECDELMTTGLGQRGDAKRFPERYDNRGLSQGPPLAMVRMT